MTREAGLLVRVGPNRLLHTEYMRTLESDAYVQMLDYRALIMRRYPETRLTQCVLLLGTEKMRMHDDPESGFSLGLKILSLPGIDRDEFLRRPSLSPLAALASGDQATRKTSAIAALKLIKQFPPERQSGMREAALILASISLESASFNAIRRELGMNLQEVAASYED